MLQRSIVPAYALASILSGTGNLVRPYSLEQARDFEPILCHLVEAREAAIRAGRLTTIEAIERAIVVATLDFKPRPSARYLRVINGMMPA